VARRSADHEGAGGRQAQAPPSSPARDTIASSPPLAPTAAERPIFLALLTREPAVAVVGDASLVPTAPDRPWESAEAAESHPSAPPADPPATDPVRAAALALDAPPLDLSAVQRGVDALFAGLAEFAREGGAGASVPLVPALIAVTALAYACGRRWGAARAGAAPSSEEDPVADPSREE
jgi:hypothetical protein